MKRSMALFAFCAMSFALSGCGSGGGGSGASMPPAANTSFEVFVRGVMADDPNALPREINDVPFTNEVDEATFDDAFPA